MTHALAGLPRVLAVASLQVICVAMVTSLICVTMLAVLFAPLWEVKRSIVVVQRRTGYGSVTSPNSALPSRSRILCKACEMWTAVGWGEKRILAVRVAAI